MTGEEVRRPYQVPAIDAVTTLPPGKEEHNWEERVNTVSLDAYVPGTHEEKKLLRQIDFRIGTGHTISWEPRLIAFDSSDDLRSLLCVLFGPFQCRVSLTYDALRAG